jgi:hypothetical protein
LSLRLLHANLLQFYSGIKPCFLGGR